MKKLVFLSLVAVFILGIVETGLTQGCCWMRKDYRYNEVSYPRNNRTWGMPRWRGMYYDELTTNQKESIVALNQKY